MSRKGYTLVEALTAIFVLAIGLLALTAFIVAGVMETNRAVRTQASQQCFDNALALARIASASLPIPMPNRFVWVYQPQKSPAFSPALSGLVNAQEVPYTPPDPLLGLSLDISGPYDRVDSYTNPGTGQTDRRPFFTGRRMVPRDPERYTWAYAIRPVPQASPDQMLVDVSVVVFEDYDQNDPQGNPYVLAGALLQQGLPILLGAAGQVPSRAIILDGQNGYVYRLAGGKIIPQPRANSNSVIVLPRAVESLELGILSRR